MIHYKLSVKNPNSHYINVTLTINNITSNTVELQLPAWRPGRYELGNFAKNIKRVDVVDVFGNSLKYIKTTKDLWVIETSNCDQISVTYSYHTTEINGGNCYADETQLYVNPVHLCMYVPNRMSEQHVMELDIADNYKIATSLPLNHKTLTAQSFDELADSPFIASPNIQSEYYEVNEIKFWLHFNGECKPDFKKIKSDFIKFTQTQLSFWGGFPVNDYHFLFQILPYKFYHGVEHQRSTVIALGQGYGINSGTIYENLLGVSSHELFHTWNIKYIRPAEMLPYNFTAENYARTGYVYEGFTTYYGDVLLLTSGAFTTQQYFNTLEERIVKHFHNYGRFNLSVADSSLDTWLDGYVPGAPYRKTSIYDEGNLVAFMLDVLIMKHSNQTKNLRDVCRFLYDEFGKKNKGYTENDIIHICETIAGTSLKEFFTNFVYGCQNFETQLTACFNYLDIEMQKKQSPHVSEFLCGFKTIDYGTNRKVSLIAPESPSWKAGLSIGDEIIAVNGYTLKNDFNDWMTYFKDFDLELTVSSNQQLKTIKIANPTNKFSYFDSYVLKQKSNDDSNFKKWMLLNS